MKRKDIENHSRAAFYLKARGWGLSAGAAWQSARRLVDQYQTRLESYLAAQDNLREVWESLGKFEPKRFSPEGQRIQTARQEARAASNALSESSAYRGAAPAPYAGSWQPGQPGLYYCENPESMFRNVLKACEVSREIPGGWYDNPYGESSIHDDSGLVVSWVAQLPGRAGAARYVAGFSYGGSDSGVTFDLSEMHENSDDMAARQEAARAADSMAEFAAEKERDYRAAHDAGWQWQELNQEIESARASCLALLAERHKARGLSGPELPEICRAIRESISGHIRMIKEARKEKAQLAAGECEPFFWAWSRHDESGLVAFAEGAGLPIHKAREICS